MKKREKKKGNKKGDKNKQTPEIKQRIETYQVAEAIVKTLIDKIIILSVREYQKQKVDKLLGDFCFNKLKKQMTSLFETNFINHTDDLNHENPQILWEMISPPDNTWVELEEPAPLKIDRYEYYSILYQELKKNNDKLPNPQINDYPKKESKIKDNKFKKKEPLADIIEEENNLNLLDKELIINNDVIPEYSRIEEDVSKSILSVSDAEIKNVIGNQQDKIIFPQNEIINENKNKQRTVDFTPDVNKSKNNTLKVSTNNPTENTLTKSKKNLQINFPSYDIPNILEEFNHDIFNPENVDSLRKEREKLLIKKQIERKEREKEIEKQKQKITEEKAKVNTKLIDTNRLTFDSNGNIIHFRPYRLDTLTKDFLITKNTIKNAGDENTGKKGKRFSVTKVKKEDKIEEIIKNEEEERKYKEMKSIIEMNNTEKFIPSGSNFQIMSPNIGVIINENGVFKEGPRDFSKHFKKYSLKDYDKMLNDLLPLQNRTFIKNKYDDKMKAVNHSIDLENMNKKKKTSLNNSNNINKSINSNTEILNNPLLPNAEQSLFVDKGDNSNININNISSSGRKSIPNNSINLNMNSNNNPLLSSNMNSMNFNKNIDTLNTLNFDNSIVMKKLGSTSLKLELDSVRDLININPEDMTLNKNFKHDNILDSGFRKNYMKLTTINDNNTFSEFNKKIMNTTGWGSQTIVSKKDEMLSGNKSIYARHQTKQQILRELGNTILSGYKVKLPRGRKVDIVSNNK